MPQCLPIDHSGQEVCRFLLQTPGSGVENRTEYSTSPAYKDRVLRLVADDDDGRHQALYATGAVAKDLHPHLWAVRVRRAAKVHARDSCADAVADGTTDTADLLHRLLDYLRYST